MTINNTIYEQAIELAHRKIKLGKYENISEAYKLKLVEDCYNQILLERKTFTKTREVLHGRRMDKVI